MPSDALLQIQPLVTKTASFTSAPLILPGGTPFRSDSIRVVYSSASNASGSNAVVFALSVSKDGGTTFNVESQSDPITLSTTPAGGEIVLPLKTKPTSVANGIQVQLVQTQSGAGTTPTITYVGDFIPN